MFKLPPFDLTEYIFLNQFRTSIEMQTYNTNSPTYGPTFTFPVFPIPMYSTHVEVFPIPMYCTHVEVFPIPMYSTHVEVFPISMYTKYV